MNQSRNRALYEKVKGEFTGCQPTLSYLREEFTIVNNQNSYRLDFNGNVPGRATERKLSIKDAFVANKIGLFLVAELKTKPGSGALLTYPNPVAVAQAGAVTPADLESLYNGSMKAQIDQEVLFDGLDTRRFRRVPHTQLSAVNDNDQQTHEDGLVDIEPNIKLNGARKNEFTITLPAFAVAPNMAAIDAAWDIRGVMVLYGYHVPGGANLRNQR